MLYYTGLKNFNAFIDVLATLGPAAYSLKYLYCVPAISVKNQLFLTLMRLRCNKAHFELSREFNISKTDVSNIFNTWIRFMALQWREIDIWPRQELVHFFSPTSFFANFPRTRVIVDGTEVPIKKPRAPLAQQSTFSTYKNRNTAKVLVGCSPGGLVSYVSRAYGGSTSDRQIVERSRLTEMCEPGDAIMADKDLMCRICLHPVTFRSTFQPSSARRTGSQEDKSLKTERLPVNEYMLSESLAWERSTES